MTIFTISLSIVLFSNLWPDLGFTANEIIWIHLPIKVSDVSDWAVCATQDSINLSDVCAVIGPNNY